MRPVVPWLRTYLLAYQSSSLDCTSGCRLADRREQFHGRDRTGEEVDRCSNTHLAAKKVAGETKECCFYGNLGSMWVWKGELAARNAGRWRLIESRPGIIRLTRKFYFLDLWTYKLETVFREHVRLHHKHV